MGQKTKKLAKLAFALIAIILMLDACTPAPPKNTTAGQAIQATLQNSIRKDQNIADKPKAVISQKINNALLPPLTLQAPISNGQPGEPHRFDVAAKDLPAKNFFMGLVADTKLNMLVDPSTTGKITVNLKNVTIEEALEATREMYGYQYQKYAYGYQILPPKMKTQIFTVNYLNVKRSGQSQTQLASTELSNAPNGSTSVAPAISGASSQNGPIQVSGSGSTVVTKTDDDFWAGLNTTLKTIIGDQNGRWVVVNPQASIVMAHAYPNELHEVSEYLDTIQNNLQREVIIEAKILEIILKDDYQAGINWKALTAMQGSGDGLSSDFSSNGGIFSLALSGHHGDFTSVIDLLESQGNVQVLSSPHISTVNNQEAVIKVGDDEYFVTGYTSNVTPSGNNNTTSQSVSLNPFFSGITLDVTPQIGNDGSVTLYIHPSISTVADQNKEIQLNAQSDSGSSSRSSNNNNNTLILPLARSTIRESDNIVHAKTGQVVVIGGLMQNLTSEQIAATPWLNKLPFVGALARNTNQKSIKTELVILLRPVIVDNHAWQQQLQGEASGFQELQRGFHVGSRSDTFGTQAEANP